VSHTPQGILVVTSVHHGNTMKVAEAMSSATGMGVHFPGEKARGLIEAGMTPFLGSGIFFGHHHSRLLEFADSLPEVDGSPAFIFSTSGTGIRAARWFGRHYHRRLAELLEAKGFKVAGEFDCKGFDTYGPWGKLGGVAKGHPNKRDLQMAEQFATSVLDPLSPRDIETSNRNRHTAG